jgi:hypothetical protein
MNDESLKDLSQRLTVALIYSLKIDDVLILFWRKLVILDWKHGLTNGSLVSLQSWNQWKSIFPDTWKFRRILFILRMVKSEPVGTKRLSWIKIYNFICPIMNWCLPQAGFWVSRRYACQFHGVHSSLRRNRRKGSCTRFIFCWNAWLLFCKTMLNTNRNYQGVPDVYIKRALASRVEYPKHRQRCENKHLPEN